MSEHENLGFMKAAERVLSESGEPLHYDEITRRGLEKGRPVELWDLDMDAFDAAREEAGT
jgi:hypothetical protein